MDKIKLIRYANEGFVNHSQRHIASRTPIVGAFAFIGSEYEELLRYKSKFQKDHPDLQDRSLQQRHEIELSGDTLVYVRNQQLPIDDKNIYFNKTKDFVVIPVLPLVKEFKVGNIDFPMSLEAYVQVSLSFASRQLAQLLNMYDKIREETKTNDITINTRIIDFCECIVSVDSM